jgi:hypothetical protein
MNRGVEEPLAAALGALAVTGVLGDSGDQARIDNALPVVRRLKATSESELGPSEVQPALFRHLLQRWQALWQQHHVGLIDGSHGDGS